MSARSAFWPAYAVARFCQRGRLVATAFGLRAVWNERRAWRHMFDPQGRERLGWRERER